MQPSYGRPHYAPEPPAMSLTKARPWLIGLAAGATMLVLILSLGNPPVTRTIYRHAYSSGFGSRALQGIGVVSWNLGQLGDDMHLYLAALVFDLALVALVVLLVAALSVGSGSFWRTLLAAWVSVVVAVVVSAYLRAAIINPMGVAPNKAEAIFFSQYSPNPFQLFAALLYGLIVALVAALVAVLTRRRQVVTADRPVPTPPPVSPPEPGGTEPARREPWSAPPAAVPGPVANPSPWSKTTDEEHTTQLPAVGEADDGAQHTRALPRIADDRPHS